MNFTLDTGISAATVFVQGLLSFFSPCVLPLLPIYMGYLAGTAGREEGKASRVRTAVNPLFFVLGISFAFFLLGLGMTALGRFLSDHRTLLTQLGGVLILLFGLYQLGAFGSVGFMEEERRLPLALDKLAMSPLTALLMGFVFSFAWTPCVGPALSSVLIMAASSATAGRGFLLVGVYTLGFVLPFLAAGLFGAAILDLFRKHRSAVKYTVRIGGVIMVIVGLLMITGAMDRISGFFAGTQEPPAEAGEAVRADPEPDPDAVPAPDFQLTDQYGVSHKLSDYKGKTVFLNFWATWCPPCRAEMPYIQALYEKYGPEGDVAILAVASPGIGSETDLAGVTAFLKENGYTYPVLMDTTGEIMSAWRITALPTTFMIDARGNIYGYVPGGMDQETMQSIIDQTISGASN